MSLILDGTNGLSDVDGTAGTPAIRGSDANTGVFFGTDIVGVSTGGSERVRVNASGNVGIGTSSPASKFNVVGGRSSFAANSENFSVYLQYNSATNGFYIGSPSADAMVFSSSGGAERMRIDSSGNLLVGTTATTPNPGIGLFPAGNITVGNSAGGSGFEFHTFRRSGTQIGSITQSGTTAVLYNTSSDYRLKHDIQPMTGALAKVASLKPVTYKWNVDDSNGEGFIAHELAEVCPDAVCGEKDAVNEDGSIKPQGIDTSFLVATLTAAIQEQQAIIESLTARVVALEGQP